MTKTAPFQHQRRHQHHHVCFSVITPPPPPSSPGNQGDDRKAFALANPASTSSGAADGDVVVVVKRGSRRVAIVASVGALLSLQTFQQIIFPEPAFAANDAVLSALKQKETKDLVEGGAVTTRLNTALDELRRAQQLASVGEYDSARQMLRKGALVSLRGDLEKVGAYLRVRCKQRDNATRRDDATRCSDATRCNDATTQRANNRLTSNSSPVPLLFLVHLLLATASPLLSSSLFLFYFYRALICRCSGPLLRSSRGWR